MKKHQPKEEQVQSAIVSGLTALGYTVLQTTVRYRRGDGARGGYGATPGVPDVLVTHPDWPKGMMLGIEVKGPATPLSDAQRGLWRLGRIAVARSLPDALLAVAHVERALSMEPSRAARLLAGFSTQPDPARVWGVQP